MAKYLNIYKVLELKKKWNMSKRKLNINHFNFFCRLHEIEMNKRPPGTKILNHHEKEDILEDLLR